jgi:hypothetical protein
MVLLKCNNDWRDTNARTLLLGSSTIAMTTYDLVESLLSCFVGCIQFDSGNGGNWWNWARWIPPIASATTRGQLVSSFQSPFHSTKL